MLYAGRRAEARQIKLQNRIWRKIKRHWQLYFVVVIPVILLLIFSYGPMYGLQIAFKDFSASLGIWESEWVGLKHFETFLTSHQFPRLIKNTLGISLYTLAAGFPIPIILAISLNECQDRLYKKTVQMFTYAPHFISTVVMAGIILMFLAPRSGLLNQFITLFGGTATDFMAEPAYFKSIYVWSGIWQNMGYSFIIYLSALSGIDPALHEAALVDGATKAQTYMHITLPLIKPTLIYLTITSLIGGMQLFDVPSTLSNGDGDPRKAVLTTSMYLYNQGFKNHNYGYASAISVGLFIIIGIMSFFAFRAMRRKDEDA